MKVSTLAALFLVFGSCAPRTASRDAGTDASAGAGDTTNSGGTAGTAAGGAGPAGGTAGAGAGPDAGQCATNQKRCGAACVATDDPAFGCDSTSCATCAFDHATATCAAGGCALGSCAPDFDDCDGQMADGCETDLQATVTDCGACGNSCAPGQSCVAGACTGSVTPPSCQGSGSGAGAADCGPNAGADCCRSNLVPGGTFSRSYDAVTYTDASYTATVSDFKLDVYEVTVGRFRRFVEAGEGTQAKPPAPGDGASSLTANGGWQSAWNPHLPADTAALETSVTQDCGAYSTWTNTVGANERRPMNCLSWYEAFAFCAWDGGRLPTEAEWNYAAAGGIEQRVYPWSNPPASTQVDFTHAVYWCGGDGKCYPECCSQIGFVGSRSPQGDGKFGQADLAGNVSEWVLDLYESPYAMPCTNCANTSSGSDRVLRGGNWYEQSTYLAASSRDHGDPATTSVGWMRGVRCARNAP